MLPESDLDLRRAAIDEAGSRSTGGPDADGVVASAPAVVDEPRDGGGPGSVAIAAGLLLACALLIWLTFRPGYMNADSLMQYGQVKSGDITDWYDPVLLWLWRVVLRGVTPSAILFLQTSAMLLGFYEVLRGAVRRRWLASLGAVLLTLSPPVLAQVMIISRDTWLAAFGVLAAGAIMRAQRTDGWIAVVAWVAAGLSLLGAAASRQNAAPIIVALAVPSIVLLGRRWLAGHRRWVSAVIVLVTSLAVGVGALLVVRVAQSTMGVRSTNPGAALQAYDTAAISLRSGEIYLDPVTFPAQDLDVLQNSFKPGSGINLYTGSPPVLSFPSTGVPDDQAARITHDWRRAVTDHPGEYLSARSDFWLRLVGLRSTTPWYVVHPSGIDGNGLGFELHNQRGDDAARRYLGLFADAPDFNTGGWLFKPWLYMLMAAGVGAWLLRRHRREVGAQVMAALAIGSILYEVTFFLAGVSAYYRYSYPTVVWALLAGAYAAVLGVGDRRARRAAHRPAPGSRVVHYGVLTAGAAILVIVMVGVVTNVPTLADSAVSPGMYVVTTGAGDASVAGSLPWAVAQANSHRGVDYVRFGAAVTDISIDAPLVVTGVLSIDGQRYGSSAEPRIVGAGGLDRLIVLTASAPGSSINHLHLAGFRQSAIEVQAGASGGFLVGNTVEVGSGATAMSVAAERIGILNNVVTGAGTGVRLKAGARGNGMSGNTITLCGTGTVGVRAVDSAYNYIGSKNTISAESGVVVKGAGSLGNAVTNNQFDAAAGSCATPSEVGVSIGDGATGNGVTGNTFAAGIGTDIRLETSTSASLSGNTAEGGAASTEVGSAP